jgi:subtilisin family serine protease
MKSKSFLVAGILALVSGAATAQGVSLYVAQAICADYNEAGGKVLIETAAASSDAVLVKAIVLHNLAYYYNKSYLTEALKTLDSLSALPLARAYRGSGMTLVGRYALESKDVVTAADQTQKGLALLNQAQQSDSTNPWIRYLRLLDGIEVSRLSPFKQYDIIAADVEYLSASILSNARDFLAATGLEFDGEPGKAFRAAVLFQIGEYWFDRKKVAKALGCWDKASRISSLSRYGKLAAGKLAFMED